MPRRPWHWLATIALLLLTHGLMRIYLQHLLFQGNKGVGGYHSPVSYGRNLPHQSALSELPDEVGAETKEHFPTTITKHVTKNNRSINKQTKKKGRFKKGSRSLLFRSVNGPTSTRSKGTGVVCFYSRPRSGAKSAPPSCDGLRGADCMVLKRANPFRLHIAQER